MKKFFCFILILFMAVLPVITLEEDEPTLDKVDVSYAFGVLVAMDLMDLGLEFDYDAFIQGFREAMENEDTRFSLNEAMDIITTAFQARQTQLADYNLALGQAFLDENSEKPGIVVTSSGLQYEIITEGTGEMPVFSDNVLVHYVGTTIDGEIFDSTYEFGEPLEIPLSRVIPGWSEGLSLMREGEKARLYIPSELAYGSSGAGGYIAPNSVLIFEVELLSILPSQVLTDD